MARTVAARGARTCVAVDRARGGIKTPAPNSRNPKSGSSRRPIPERIAEHYERPAIVTESVLVATPAWSWVASGITGDVAVRSADEQIMLYN